MAINNTGAMFKSFEFDGTDSRNFGVYITGAAVYDAPEREVEMISIPNRNGAFALDKGRFENIEITYPAGIYADTEADFAEAISDLRNFLCSKRGYCRLTDEYNPNEYRMAIYKSGLEVEPALLRAGEFEITFECMPQRFLISGDTKTTMTSGNTLTNPTLFEAKPKIEASGYGDINIGNYTITLENGYLGEVVLVESGSANSGVILPLQNGMCNIGDDVLLNSARLSSYIRTSSGNFPAKSSITVSGTGSSYFTINSVSGNTLNFTFDFPAGSYTWGTAKTISYVVNLSCTSTTSEATYYRLTLNASYISWTIDGYGFRFAYSKTSDNIIDPLHGPFTNINVTADSTVTALGNPTIIDCDAGEVYKIDNGDVVALNGYVDLGSNLPVLAPGTNTITFDNTFTKIDIIPRWWII